MFLALKFGIVGVLVSIILESLFGYVWISPHLKTFQNSGFLNVLRKANATRLARSVAAAAEEWQFCMEWKSLSLEDGPVPYINGVITML